jgi:hypothetical protein
MYSYRSVPFSFVTTCKHNSRAGRRFQPVCVDHCLLAHSLKVPDRSTARAQNCLKFTLQDTLSKLLQHY